MKSANLVTALVILVLGAVVVGAYAVRHRLNA